MANQATAPLPSTAHTDWLRYHCRSARPFYPTRRHTSADRTTKARGAILGGAATHHFQARGQAFGDHLRHGGAVPTTGCRGQPNLHDELTQGLGAWYTNPSPPRMGPTQVLEIRDTLPQTIRLCAQHRGDVGQKRQSQQPRRIQTQARIFPRKRGHLGTGMGQAGRETRKPLPGGVLLCVTRRYTDELLYGIRALPMPAKLPPGHLTKRSCISIARGPALRTPRGPAFVTASRTPRRDA